MYISIFKLEIGLRYRQLFLRNRIQSIFGQNFKSESRLTEKYDSDTKVSKTLIVSDL